MKNFLGQFRSHLTPMQYMQMEQRMFRAADNFVPGYNGGTWPSQKVGNAWAVVFPSAGNVRIVSPMNGADETMDAKSAGLALSILVVSWTWELLHEVLTDSGNEKFSKVREQLMDAITSDAFIFSAAGIGNVID